jgi:hypothetical protein
MRRTRVAVLLSVLFLVVGLSSRGASAKNICVTASATAPVIGTRSGMRCVPSPYTQTFWFQNCRSIPPAGFYMCVTLTADLP